MIVWCHQDHCCSETLEGIHARLLLLFSFSLGQTKMSALNRPAFFTSCVLYLGWFHPFALMLANYALLSRQLPSPSSAHTHRTIIQDYCSSIHV